MNKLSVVIVNFNSGEFLTNCLTALESSEGDINFDICVVDNASDDNSIDLAKKSFPKINYILEKNNLGFSKANNLGLREAKYENILILNPDTEIAPNTIKYMFEFMETRSDIGAVTCRVELSNGRLDWGSHRGFPTPLTSFLYYFLKNDTLYHLSGKDMNINHEIDSISGAFLMTKKSVLNKVGLFDENYFMYAEDIDLCYRIKKAGYKIMFVPAVKIIHYKGVASGIKGHSQEITTATKKSKEIAFHAFYDSIKIFYKKNLEKSYPFFINWLVYLGINLKWFLDKRKLHV